MALLVPSGCGASDIQMIIHESADEFPCAIHNLQSCLNAVELWMSTNRLCLNASKTELTYFGTRQQLTKLTIECIQLGGIKIPIGLITTSLGIRLDSQLKMSARVSDIV